MNPNRVSLFLLLLSLTANAGSGVAAIGDTSPYGDSTSAYPNTPTAFADLRKTKKDIAAGALTPDSLFALMSEGNGAGRYTDVAELAEIALGTPPPLLSEIVREATATGGGPSASSYEGVAVYKNDDRIYNEAGVAYYMTNRIAAAKWAYEEAVRLNPRAADPLANLGLLFRRKGRYEEALAYYERALATTGAGATVWYNRGVCLLRLGRLEEAVSSFETASRISPKYGSPLRRLALLWYELGDIDTAASYAEKYEYLVRTDIAASPGQKEEAARLLETIRKRLASPRSETPASAESGPGRPTAP